MLARASHMMYSYACIYIGIHKVYLGNLTILLESSCNGWVVCWYC